MNRSFEICIEDLETDFQISKFGNNPQWQSIPVSWEKAAGMSRKEGRFN